MRACGQLPWRRMAWVTWRQHRTALIGVLAFIGALALCFLIVGLQLHHAYAAATACHPASSAACNAMVANFNGIGNFLSNGVPLQVVPPLIGAFVGAPVLAREFEAGTFRFAWTQGFGRWRWTLAKLVGLGVVVAAASGALSVLASWYYQPYFASGNQSLSLTKFNPLNPGLFDLRGIGFAAWTLAAFAIGALAGVLIRRVVPTIVTTLAVYAGLAFATGGWLRMHYLTPLVTKGLNVPGSAADREPMGKQGRPGRLHRAADVSYLPAVLPRCGGLGQGRRAVVRESPPVPGPARLHVLDQLPAGQPVLAVPVDRGWLAARAVRAAHRRDRLAGPPPRGLNAVSRARVSRKQLDRDRGRRRLGGLVSPETRGRAARRRFVRRSRRLGPHGPYSVAERPPAPR